MCWIGHERVLFLLFSYPIYFLSIESHAASVAVGYMEWDPQIPIPRGIRLAGALRWLDMSLLFPHTL